MAMAVERKKEEMTLVVGLAGLEKDHLQSVWTREDQSLYYQGHNCSKKKNVR
jgi:hypothetical protein